MEPVAPLPPWILRLCVEIDTEYFPWAKKSHVRFKKLKTGKMTRFVFTYYVHSTLFGEGGRHGWIPSLFPPVSIPAALIGATYILLKHVLI